MLSEGRAGRLGEKEGIQQKTKQQKKILMDTNKSMVITTRKEGMGEAEKGKGGINSDARRLDLG